MENVLNIVNYVEKGDLEELYKCAIVKWGRRRRGVGKKGRGRGVNCEWDGGRNM